jgi:VCBS repeat-containing protein
VSDKAAAAGVKAPAATPAQVSGQAQSVQAAEVAEEVLLQQADANQVGEDPVAVLAAEEEVEQAASDAVAEPALNLTDGLAAADGSNAGMPARAPVDSEEASALQDGDDEGGISPVLLGVLGLAAIGGGIALFGGGSSNKPPVAVDDTFGVNEGSGTANLSVATNDSDPNRNDTLTFAANGTLPAGVSLSSSGALTFDSNNAAYNSLAAGQTRVLTFGYTVTDSKGASATGNVTLTVTGTNDAPVVAAALTNSASEDAAAFTVNMLQGASDVDAGNTLSVVAASVTGLEAGVAFAGSTLSVNPNAFNSLAAGETKVITVRYNITDGTATVPQTATITITGANDAPVVAAALTNTASEDAAAFTVNMLAGASDPDTTNTLSVVAASVTGLEAGVTFAGSTLSVDPNAFNSLAVGQTKVITVSYNITDGTATVPQTATITITGANDAPVAVADVAAATEGVAAPVTGSVATNDSDVDATDVLTYALNAPVAGLTLNANGTYSFDATNAAYNGLAAGQIQAVVANYTVSDGNGGTATSTLTITVTGTNDAPVAVADVAEATEDGDEVTGSVADNDSDVDDGAVLTYALAAPVAGLTLSDDGSYSFDPTDAAYQSLALGETLDVVAEYTVTDENGAEATSMLTITVTGTNDAPVITSGATATVAENAPVATVVYDADATDVDASDEITYSLTGADAALLTIDSSTGVVRLLASANFERQASLSFTVVATDSVDPSLSDSQDVTVAVTDEIDVLSLDVGTAGDAVTINAGIQTGDATDTNFRFNETLGAASEVNITNFGANDFIQFDGADPADYTFQNDGNGNLVISAVAPDGATVSIITLVGTGIAADRIVVTEADAEAALGAVLGAGDYFRGNAGPPVTVQTTGNPVIAAAGRATIIVEDLSGPESSSIINGFRSDDIIRFINGLAGEITFTTDTDPRDLRIDYVDAVTGNVSTIIINDVLRADGPIVFNEATAEAALALSFGAGDYFQFG